LYASHFKYLVATVLMVLMAGCGGQDPDETAAAVPVRQVADGPPVILIGLDTVRGDYLHVAGMSAIKTPHMDALAADGVYFPHCQSTSPWTGPSFASIYTGLLPYHHGFLGGAYSRLGDRFTTVAEYCQADGYPTGGFVTIGWLTKAYGMTQGYDTGQKLVDDDTGGSGPKVTRAGLDFARSHRGRPFFMFLHYFDAHAPYLPPAPYDEMYYQGDKFAPGEPINDYLQSEENLALSGTNQGQMYDWLEGVTDWTYPSRQYPAGVSYVDSHVGDVVAGLKSQGIYDEALIILVADHGEHLGQHGLYFTHAIPFQEALRVPLIIKWPGGEFAGTRVETPVSTLDVLPTLLSVLGRAVPTDIDGRDLTPLAADPLAAGGSLLMAEEGASVGRFIKTVREGEWKLMVYWVQGVFHPTLYNLALDPGETRDVAAENPDVVARLRARLDAVFAPNHPLAGVEPLPPVMVNEAELQKLRSLGYAR